MKRILEEGAKHPREETPTADVIDLLFEVVKTNLALVNQTALNDLGAFPETELPQRIGLPLSTYQQLKSQGLGPKTFKLGRRIFVHIDAAREWLSEMAKAAEDAA